MDWANIINAIGTIILGWFTYNQYTKHKLTDYNIEKLRQEDKVKNKRRADNSMIVFGELWSVLYELKADRVYVVQPHPLGNEEMLTVCFEVKRRWAEPMKPHIQKLKMGDVAKFSATLADTLFLYIKDIDKDVQDRYAKSIFSSCGCQHAMIKRLSDNRHDWVGSIFVEFTDDVTVTEEYASEVLHSAATSIQYILPEIKE